VDFLSEFLTLFISKLQSPTLGFLLGGMVVAALGSRLTIPDAVYKFIVFMLLIKVGLSGGVAIRNANLAEMLLPALFAMVIGIAVVFIARYTLARLPGVKTLDGCHRGLVRCCEWLNPRRWHHLAGREGIAIRGLVRRPLSLYGYPSASDSDCLGQHLCGQAEAGKVSKNAEYISKGEYSGMQPVAAGGYSTVDPRGAEGGYSGESGGSGGGSSSPSGAAPSKRVKIWPIIKESLQGSALSALLLGLAWALLPDRRASMRVSTIPPSAVCFRS
jgi:hypothetical protein